jgi:hypothetical protein
MVIQQFLLQALVEDSDDRSKVVDEMSPRPY